MPLSRRDRQSRPRRQRATSGSFTPRVDVFGTLRTPEGEARVRLMEYAPSAFAAFSAESPENPLLFMIEGDFHMKGRLLTATLASPVPGAEVKFQKAGCGCETPHQLRGARRPLLEAAGLLPDGVLEPDVGQPLERQEYPTPDELTASLGDIPGAAGP